MELKAVTEEQEKKYAKKDEISKKMLKAMTPEKWILASSLGIVTLFYSSSNISVSKIGIVVGCIELVSDRPFNTLGTVLNYGMDIFYYLTIVLGLSFVVKCIHHFVKKSKYDENDKIKSRKTMKKLAAFFVICMLVTIGLAILLSSNLEFLHEKPAEKNMTDSIPSISSYGTSSTSNPIKWKFGW